MIMNEIFDSNTALLRDVITAAEAQATGTTPTAPLPAKNPETNTSVTDSSTPKETSPPVEIPSFKGFNDFTLDLTCLSPPPSPPASIYTDARSTSNSPSASPRHSISLSFRSASPSRAGSAAGLSSVKSSSNLLPSTSGASVIRGSWPLMRYVGRGTPIDKNRRIEWGAASTEGGVDDDVGEDGVLFTTVRATSLDSARHSNRSISPEWNNILDRRPSVIPSRKTRRSISSTIEPPSPAIQIEGLGSEKPGEWAESFMQTVLRAESSSSNNNEEASTSQLTPSTSQMPASTSTPLEPMEEKDEPLVPTMSPEEIDQLDTGLDIDLGIDGALDLGLGYHGGMNWFDLGMLPASGRESPSVYSSQAPSPTPRPSRPQSTTPTLQNNRSTASLKADATDTAQSAKTKTSASSSVWWRRILRRLKKAIISH